MSGASFNVGDVVSPKAGGPKMTVIVVFDDGTDHVEVAWFDGDELMERTLHKGILQKEQGDHP